MALIKCVECNKEISDTAKTCPHCGYKLKKKLNFNKLDIDIFSAKTLSFILLILSFVASFFDISFAKDYYGTGRRLSNYSFNDIMYNFIDILDIIYIVIGSIAILLLLYVVIRKKLKFKGIYYYIPLFLYNLIAVVISFAVIFGTLTEHTSRYDTYYGILWGGIWILIMLSTSSALLVVDLIKKRKKA